MQISGVVVSSLVASPMSMPMGAASGAASGTSGLDSPLFIDKIDGLGPVDLNNKLGDRVGMGATYQGRRPGTRRITINGEIQVGWNGMDAADIREMFYGLINDDFPLTIEFHRGVFPSTDIRIATGYLAIVEIDIFTDTPTLMLAFDCPEAYFESNADTTFYTIPKTPFIYKGNFSTGFYLDFITAKPYAKMAIITNETGISFSKSIPAGAKVILKSEEGMKDLYYFPDANSTSNRTSLLTWIDPGSVWPKLRTGSNLVQVIDPLTGYDITLANFYMTFTQKYWGL